jgi:hypothetical protein
VRPCCAPSATCASRHDRLGWGSLLGGRALGGRPVCAAVTSGRRAAS